MRFLHLFFLCIFASSAAIADERRPVIINTNGQMQQARSTDTLKTDTQVIGSGTTSDAAVTSSTTNLQVLRNATPTPASTGVGGANEFPLFSSITVPEGHGGGIDYEVAALYGRCSTKDPNTDGNAAYDCVGMEAQGISLAPSQLNRVWGNNNVVHFLPGSDGMGTGYETDVLNQSSVGALQTPQQKNGYVSVCRSYNDCTAAYVVTSDGVAKWRYGFAGVRQNLSGDCFSCLLEGLSPSLPIYAGIFADGHTLAQGSSIVTGQPGTTRYQTLASGPNASAMVKRWEIGANGTAESFGTNAGSDYQICRYGDDGSFLSCPLLMQRSSGALFLNNGVTLTAGSGNLGLAAAGVTPSLAVGSSIYPTNIGGSSAAKYDATSNILTNVVGAKYGMFGVAAKDNVQWPNTYVPGIDASGHATLFAVSPNGFYGSFGASRSSDSAVSSANVVGSGGLSVCDNAASLDQVCWGQYSAAYTTASSGYLASYGHEFTMRNGTADSPIADPYAYNNTRETDVMRMTCGDGATTSYKCSAFMVAAFNNAPAKAGLVFGSTALDTSGGVAPMLSGVANYGVNWYGAAGQPTWQVYANTGNGAHKAQMVLGDNTFDVYFQTGAYHPISADTNGVTVQTALRLRPGLYVDLPTCNTAAEGSMAYITDALAPVTAWHQAVTAGGGTTKTFVQCAGTGWQAF